MRPGQKLNVYGFNWNPQAWFMHKMDSEQKIIKRLFRGLDVTIHPTACDGMYTCHKLCDGLFYRIAKDGDKAVCEAKVHLTPSSIVPIFLTLHKPSAGPHGACLSRVPSCSLHETTHLCLWPVYCRPPAKQSWTCREHCQSIFCSLGQCASMLHGPHH